MPLNDLTAQAALANTVPLKSALDVTANSTYIVFESKQHVRYEFTIDQDLIINGLIKQINVRIQSDGYDTKLTAHH